MNFRSTPPYASRPGLTCAGAKGQAKSLPYAGDRNGFTLLEVSVAAVLLLALMAVTVQLLASVTGGRVAVERRQWATQQASNVMDRLTALEWSDLDADRLAAFDLSSQARQALPEGDVIVQLVELAGPPRSKQLTVEVTWQSSHGQSAAPVRLTCWVFRRGGAEE